MNIKRKVGILTSGGDSPGMNAAIRSAVRSSIYYGMEPYAIKRGFDGLIEGDIEKMESSSVSDILYRGGTILRTARSLRFMTDVGRQKALDTLKESDISDLIIIGGDGSFKGALALSKAGINIMAIPGTIDNDMSYTDYTIGFDTALNTAAAAIGSVRDTSSSHERATIVEVMGRNCGDIAIWAGVSSGVESIIVPEIPVDVDSICSKVTQGRKRGKLHNIIVKAEGVDIDCYELAELISVRTGMETKVVVLGYILRGGTPTVMDRIRATEMAHEAVKKIYLSEEKNLAIGIQNGGIVSTSLEQALNTEKAVDDSKAKLIDILNV